MFAHTPNVREATVGVLVRRQDYSDRLLVETAKENGLHPFAYLTYLFERLPNLDTTDRAALDRLLP